MAKIVSTTIPAPILGMNTEQGRDVMDPLYCLEMRNCYPLNGIVRRRPAFNSIYSISANVGTGRNGIDYLINFNNEAIIGLNSTGVKGPWLMYPGVAPTLIPGSASGTMQYSSFGGACLWSSTSTAKMLIITDGINPVCYYNGTNVTVANLRYPHATILGFLHSPCVFKGWLFLSKAQTCELYYIDTINFFTTQDLTLYELGPFFHLGGYIIWIGTWSGNTGNALDDFLVVISNRGEILLFAGTDPSSASTWAMVGRYKIPRVDCFRHVTYRNADVIICTHHGVYLLSDIINLGQTAEDSYVTGNISSLYRNLYDYTGNQLVPVYYKKNQELYLLNHNKWFDLETQSNYSYEGFLVGNVKNKTWSVYNIGDPTSMGVPNYPKPLCGVEFQDKLYFICDDGNNVISNYKLTVMDPTLNSDSWGSIPIYLKTSYNYLGDRAHLKRFISAEIFSSMTSATGSLFGNVNNTFMLEADMITALPKNTFTIENKGASKAFLTCWGKNISLTFYMGTTLSSSHLSAFNIIYERGEMD